MDEIQSSTLDKTQYFHVGTLKFCLMSLCTLGIYNIYWSYKNWSFVKQRDGSDILPFWRGIFAPLWYFSLLTDISEHSNSKINFSGVVKGVLVTVYFLLNALWRLPDPYWLFGCLAFIPILPAVIAIDNLNGSQLIQGQSRSHSIGNFATYLIGGACLTFLVLSSFNYFPSTTVVDGSRLSESDLVFLKEEGLIEDNERILYFYSNGILSIKDDGQFISDGYVVSYYRNPEDGELYGGNVAYENIEDVSVEWSSSFLDDTIVRVTDIDNNEFELWVSSEAERDKIFVDELMMRWKTARGNVVRKPNQSIQADQPSAGL